MKIRNFVIGITTALTLTACIAPAPRLDVNNPQIVANAINVKYDEFKKMTTYTGPNISSIYGNQLFIRSWKTDLTGSTAYQIYVQDHYSGDWRFYNSANDSNGIELDTKLLAREVGYCSQYGCSKDETLGLKISREYLEKNQETGIRFKVSGKAGEAVFFIPAGYIKGFLSSVN